MSFVPLADIIDAGDPTSIPSRSPSLYVPQHRPRGGDALEPVA